jgi:hypothetical protein
VAGGRGGQARLSADRVRVWEEDEEREEKKEEIKKEEYSYNMLLYSFLLRIYSVRCTSDPHIAFAGRPELGFAVLRVGGLLELL